MKRIIIIFSLVTLAVGKGNTQECLTGSCSLTGSYEYPTGGPFTPTTSWQTKAYMNAGNWTRFNVTSGLTYEWTYCEAYGGVSTAWDAQLTLRNYTTGSVLCYSDDECGTNGNAPYIRWTATFTGVVQLLTSVYNCTTNSGPPYNTLAYRQAGVSLLNCIADVEYVQINGTTVEPGSSTTVLLNNLNETFLLRLRGRNGGTETSPANYNNLTASFPQYTSSSDKNLVSVNSSTNSDMIVAKYWGSEALGGDAFADYVMVEGVDNNGWGPDESNNIYLDIKPKSWGTFKIKFREGLGRDQTYNNFSYDPTGGYCSSCSQSDPNVDCIRFYSYEITVNVVQITAPTVTTSTQTNVTSKAATLNGSVNPNGAATTYYFQYGTTTSYGSTTTSQSAGSGTSAINVNANINYLEDGTTYHYRIVATNSAGTSYGSDRSFTTATLSINMSQPSSNITVTQGENVSLQWSGSPSSGTSVSLRRDPDNIWGNGGENWIAATQSPSGSYSWNTTDVPVGTYFVAAWISDGYNEAYDYASGTVTVLNPAPADPYEPNNTSSTAYSLPLNFSFNDAYISIAGDEDWFKVPISDIGTYTINLSSLPVNYDLYFYDPNLQLLQSSANTGTTSEQIVFTNFSMNGYYYIKVVGNSNAYHATDSYQLSGQWTAAPTNDNCSGAITLTLGSAAVTGNVSGTTQSLAANCAGTANDDVWYKFTTTSAGYYKITSVGSSSFDAVLDLRSGACNGTNIDCADATANGGTETITYSCGASTVYLIRVYDYGSDVPSTTTFTIKVEYLGPADPYEPNNTSSTAYSLPLNFSFNDAYISITGDEDWFKVPISDIGTYTINLSSLPVNYDLYFYDPNLQLLQSSANTGTTSEQIIFTNFSMSGYYYIKVVGNSNAYHATDSYQLSGQWTTAPTNNNCSGAITLTLGAAAVTGNVSGATQSLAANCAGTANDDVWYKFTTTSAGYYKITSVGSSSFDVVLDLRSGACNGTNIDCADATANGGTETITYSCGASTTYLIRVYDYGSDVPSTTTFTIKVEYLGPADPYEPNNTSSTAYSLTLNFSFNDAYISIAGDEDWFKVPIGDIGTYTINLSSLPVNYDLYFYDPNLQLLQSSINTGTTSEQIVFTNFSMSGYYYIKVVGNSNAYHATDSYQLSGQWTTAPTDPYEPNNTSTAAYILPLDFSINDAYVGSNLDEDWFKVTIGGMGIYTINLSSLPENYDLYFYDPNLLLLGSSTNGFTANEQIVFSNFTMSGYYFIKVIGFDFTSYNTSDSYQLTGQWTEAPVDPYEPNNTSTAAYLLPLDFSINDAYVGSNLDEDWFKVPIGGLGTYTINLSSLPENYDLFFYNPNLQLLGSSTNGFTANEQIVFSNFTMSGYYFIKVIGFDFTSYNTTDSYQLSANWESNNSISGYAKSNLNNFDVIPNATVTINTNPNLIAITNDQGFYQIENVPEGSHTISISHSGYTWQQSSYVLNFSGNISQNFSGQCKASPEVTYSIPTTFTPGVPFDIIVTLKNVGTAITDVDAYLDVSFPDFTTLPCPVEFISQSGFNSEPYFNQPGSPICNFNVTNGVVNCNYPAEYLLVSGTRSGILYFNQEWSYTLRVTPPVISQLTINIKGNIGDKHEPNAGTIGQQGLWENIISVSSSESIQIPTNWILVDEIIYSNFFDNILKIQMYNDGESNYSIVRLNEEIIIDRELAEFLILWHLAYINDYIEFDNQNEITDWNVFTQDMKDQITTHTSRASEYWEKRVEKANIASIPLRVGFWGSISAGAASGAAVGAVLGSFAGGVGAVPCAVVGGIGTGVVSGISYYYRWLSEDFLSLYADSLGDQYYDREYPTYFISNEWLNSKGITTTEELTYEEFKELMNQYTNIYEVGQQLSSFVDYTLVGISLGFNMFDNGAVVGTAQTIAEEVLEKILMDIGTGFSDVIIDRDADLYIYWAENSQRNHALMLSHLSRYLVDKYGLMDNNLNENSFKGNFNILHDIIFVNYLIKSNELERDYSLALRTYQIKEKESILKSTLYNTAIEQEAQRALEILVVTKNEFESEEIKLNSLKLQLNIFKENLDNAYTALLLNANNQEYLVLDLAASSINPIIINSSDQIILAIKNTFSETLNLVDINVLDAGGLELTKLNSPQSIASNDIQYFHFNVLSESSNLIREVESVKFEVFCPNSDPRFNNQFTVDIQSVLPYSIVRVSSENDIYQPGDQVKLFFNINSSINSSVDLEIKTFIYDEEINNAIFQGLALNSEMANYFEFTLLLPQDCPKGQYSIQASFLNQSSEIVYETPRLFWVQPMTIEGDLSNFDFSNCSIISSNDDFEIAQRLNDAIDNSEILFLQGLTAGDLLPAMQTDNLVLIGGDQANLLVEYLVQNGKIPANLWTNPGDANVIVVDDPFYPLAPAGNKVIVIAGYYLEDTFIAGLKLLNEFDNPQQVVSTPVFNPAPPHSFTTPIAINLSCTTPDASIHYTTNGSDPDINSPSGNSININSTTTLKARAFKTGWEPSLIKEGLYTYNPITYSISGTLMDGNGVGLNNIQISLNGSQSNSAFTNSSGYYIFNSLPAGGNYTVYLINSTTSLTLFFIAQHR